jgi:transposase InsO family protein
VSRYRFVSTMKAEGFPVDAACTAAEVSTSAYYKWLGRAASPSEAELAEAYLVNQIRDIHADSDATYGSPRVTAALRRRGYCVNHKRIERLMSENAIVGVTPRRRTPRTTMQAEGAPPLPDLINQDFSPGEPDQRWAGDITYIGTDEGWLYLASVLDLGSRRLVGWAMDETMPAGLVADALRRAAELRGGDIRGVIFHSDRGSQYLSAEYRELCDRLGVRQSAGRVATCFDNSAAESFWSSLKRELVHRYRFATRAEAMAAINAWIRRYNNVRLHSTLGYVPPIECPLCQPSVRQIELLIH